MDNDQIRDIYDNSPNMTLAFLAKKTGLTVAELKKILMEGK